MLIFISAALMHHCYLVLPQGISEGEAVSCSYIPFPDYRRLL